jgi:site-specific DNA-methyltransferase (adenine-specific)
MEKFKIYNGDCRNLLKYIPDNSVDLIVTDPPYFIDGMGEDWDDAKLTNKIKKAGVIGGLPVGMKFDREQGKRLQEFLTPIVKEYYRILKPGAFCIIFSQARLYHRVATALDDTGFELRDMLGWKYEGQAKAFSQDHFIKRRKDLSESEKIDIIKKMYGWKTPQLKPQIEPMTLAQKPKEGTFVDNWLKYNVGLMNTNESIDGMFPGNIIEVSKKSRLDDEDYKIEHLTVKPVKLIEHLIKLFTVEGQIVLDSFAGSGSHGVAALRCNRKFIGIEIEKKYYDICSKRLENTDKMYNISGNTDSSEQLSMFSA